MLRGTMVVFAGLLTIVILRRALHLHHWMGIILILAGATLVGTSRYPSDTNASLCAILAAERASGLSVCQRLLQPVPSCCIDGSLAAWFVS